MIRTSWRVILLLAAGCGPSGEQAPTPVATPAPSSQPPAAAAATVPAALTSVTEWRLVELQSMDDAQGTTKPGDPALYTMRLNGDGSVTMRLNCNRATGTWSTRPGRDETSGTFEFGPLAGTRALCPPPSLDAQLLSQAQYVRSYLIRDGRLSLSLMADGGIQIWEPVPGGGSSAAPNLGAGASSDSAAALPPAVVALLRKDYVSPDLPPTRYLAGRVDLNSDGRPELLVHLVGPMPCGTGGCPTLVFAAGEQGYALQSSIGPARPPIRVSPRSSGGWRNLIVEIGGGGGRSGHAEVAFSGGGYTRNPTVAPAKRIDDLAGTEIVIADFDSFDDARPLPPE